MESGSSRGVFPLDGVCSFFVLRCKNVGDEMGAQVDLIPFFRDFVIGKGGGFELEMHN